MFLVEEPQSSWRAIEMAMFLIKFKLRSASRCTEVVLQQHRWASQVLKIHSRGVRSEQDREIEGVLLACESVWD